MELFKFHVYAMGIQIPEHLPRAFLKKTEEQIDVFKISRLLQPIQNPPQPHRTSCILSHFERREERKEPPIREGGCPWGGGAACVSGPGAVVRAAPPPQPLCLGGWGSLCSLARQRDKPVCQWEEASGSRSCLRRAEALNGHQLGFPLHTAARRAAEGLRANSSTHFSGRSPGNGVTQPAGSVPEPIKAHPRQEPARRPRPTAVCGSDGGGQCS